jgi:putative ABC transport system permease protein
LNIINKLTLRHLKENKSRTVITTLGICVSVAMITAVFVAVASFIQLFGDMELLAGGHADAVFSVNQTQLEQLYNDDRIEKVGVEIINYSQNVLLDNDKSYNVRLGDIYIGDKTNLQQMITGDYDGIIPRNDNEIAVEESYITKNELNWKIGDTVTIPLGYIDYDEENETKQFISTGVGEFEITAILHKNPATVSTAQIIRGLDSSNLNYNDCVGVIAHIQLKEENYKSLDVLNSMIEEYHIENYEINRSFLETKFAIDKDSNLFTSIIPMALIVLAIIMIASVVLIYNAFAMSLSERVRYLGMLASVGATKSQKQKSIYYESFILGAIGIPVGIVAGIAGIAVTLKVVGKKIISAGMIAGVSDSNINMSVVVPFWAIIGIVIISVLTIFISAFIPSRKASRITPIDAIRQRSEIKVKPSKLRSPKFIRKIFGYEGELAYKNLKRNGRKSRVITVSIALSVILFLSCNYFCDAFTRAIDIEVDVPYQVMVGVDYAHKDECRKIFEDLLNVDSCYGVNNSYIELNKAGENEESLDNNLTNKELLTSTYKNLFNTSVGVYFNQIDDEDFNELCKNNNIDYSQYYGENVKLLLMNNISHKSGGSEVFTNEIIGNEIEYSEFKMIINDFIKYDESNYICNLNTSNSISFYVPESVWRNVVNCNSSDTDIVYDFGIVTSEHESVADEIYDVLDSNDIECLFVSDFVDSYQAMNTIAFVLQVFVYGFIVLISLITIANIINTISTGIAMRRKEFAMLKSVGTSPKGFNKMIVLESAFYGLKALIFALPISVGISFGMNKALSESHIPFEINWSLYLSVVIVVFAIIGISMVYSVSKLKNDSIVETLKEEIN